MHPCLSRVSILVANVWTGMIHPASSMDLLLRSLSSPSHWVCISLSLCRHSHTQHTHTTLRDLNTDSQPPLTQLIIKQTHDWAGERDSESWCWWQHPKKLWIRVRPSRLRGPTFFMNVSDEAPWGKLVLCLLFFFGGWVFSPIRGNILMSWYSDVVHRKVAAMRRLFRHQRVTYKNAYFCGFFNSLILVGTDTGLRRQVASGPL